MIPIIGEEKSWNFIKKICDYCEKNNVDLPGKSFDHYYRSPEVESKYKQWKNEKHDLINVLFSDDQIINVRLNDFPYHFEPGLIHYVVWLNPKHFNMDSDTPESRMSKKVKQYVSRFFKDKNYVYFRNEPTYRTISYIPHYHVIVNEVYSL